jgi:beta-carotene hydroxylase
MLDAIRNDDPFKAASASVGDDNASGFHAEDEYRLAQRAALKVPRDRHAELTALLRPQPSRFLIWTALHLMIWAAGVAAIVFGDHWAIDLIAVLVIASQLHALTVLQHECGHRNAFRSAPANLWMGRFLAWFIVFPFTAFTECHRRHHRYLGDPERDPDDWHYARGRRWMFPRIATFAARFTWLSMTRYGAQVRGMVLRELIFNLATMTAIGAAFTWYGWLDLFALIFVAPLLLLTMVINPISRGYEHYPMATFGADDHGRLDLARNTITVTSPTISLLWANINYHVEHHVYPAVPFYHLPRLHRLLQDHAYQRDRMLLGRVLRHRPNREADAAEEGNSAVTAGKPQ